MAILYQCSGCGAKAEENEEFCPHCSSKIVAVNTDEAEKSNESAENENNVDNSQDSVSDENSATESNESAAESSTEEVTDESTDENNEDEWETEETLTPPVSESFFEKVQNKVRAFAAKINVSPKMLGIFAGALVAVIALVIILVCVCCSDSSSMIIPENNYFCMYNAADDETIILVNGQKLKDTIDGDYYSTASSLNGKSFAVLTSEKELYLCYDEKVILIDEDVSGYKISAEGTSLIYVNSDDELILYTIKNKKSKMVSDEMPYASVSNCHLSPDGEIVLYVEGDEDDYSLCLYEDGKKSVIMDEVLPLGLSNDAEFIYYHNVKKESVYVMIDREDSVRLISDASFPTLVYNADHTQVIFETDSGTYISDNGSEKQKITSKSISLLGNTLDSGFIIMRGNYDATAPFVDFAEQYFIDSKGTLYYLDEEFEAVEIADDVEGFRAANSSDVIYYLDEDGDLYRLNGYDSDAERIAGDVETFVITSDGKACYFIDDDDTLKYVKKTGKAEKIASDVESFAITCDDYVLFVSDETLYSSCNGDDKERIDDDVHIFVVFADAAYYLVNSEEDGCYDVYGAEKKADFELIASEIER